jgi:hypothetical protein
MKEVIRSFVKCLDYSAAPWSMRELVENINIEWFDQQAECNNID